MEEKFTLIWSTSEPVLIQKVNDHLNDGWVKADPIFVHNGRMYQAMMRPDISGGEGDPVKATQEAQAKSIWIKTELEEIPEPGTNLWYESTFPWGNGEFEVGMGETPEESIINLIDKTSDDCKWGLWNRHITNLRSIEFINPSEALTASLNRLFKLMDTYCTEDLSDELFCGPNPFGASCVDTDQVYESTFSWDESGVFGAGYGDTIEHSIIDLINDTTTSSVDLLRAHLFRLNGIEFTNPTDAMKDAHDNLSRALNRVDNPTGETPLLRGKRSHGAFVKEMVAIRSEDLLNQLDRGERQVVDDVACKIQESGIESIGDPRQVALDIIDDIDDDDVEIEKDENQRIVAITPKFRGKKNRYVCRVCRSEFTTLDIDEGVTPFMISCIANGCTGTAESKCYKTPEDQLGNPELLWVKPNPDMIRHLKPLVADHVEKGGLLLNNQLPVQQIISPYGDGWIAVTDAPFPINTYIDVLKIPDRAYKGPECFSKLTCIKYDGKNFMGTLNGQDDKINEMYFPHVVAWKMHKGK